ncbi:PAS-PAC-PAC sensing histidine kinase [Haloferax prahovense DSM 18310]|uniref:histidine kinase n=1 Tax=Haloferax prahovense (strain DSM 18310 / JCM 13924 / TL6) TaxID=1227461 RepID=M0GL79_HALPT|nr:PAS domain S-box protein [Haloferax prahovense]ELZ72965.1 PAS-PAC-PAC sensing histidine kinase [Haloferax prahovense DSM 18310]
MGEDASRNGARSARDASGDERILLALHGARDRELLAELLDAYEVIVWERGREGEDRGAGEGEDGDEGAGEDPLPEFDLCIVDMETYSTVADALAERKADAGDRFVPVLLTVAQDQQVVAARRLDDVPDDVLAVPAPKAVIRSRVESLLQTRRQSLQLALYRRAMDSATVGITITEADDDQPLTYINDAFEEMTGYDRSEVLGRNCRFLQGEETDSEPVEKLHEAIEAGESVAVSLTNYRKDGTPFWNELKISPVYEDGELTHFVGFQTDATVRHALKNQLVHETQTLKQLFETSPVGIAVLNDDGIIVRANEAAQAVLGLRRSVVLGQSYDAPEWDLVDARGEPLDHEDLPFDRVRDTGETVTNFEHGIGVDGERRWLVVHAAPLTRSDGEHVGVIAAIEDVTAQKRQERERERLLDLFDQSQKIASVGAWEVNAESGAVLFTSGLAELLGVDPGTVFDLSEAFSFYHPEDEPLVRAAFERLVETGEEQSVECRLEMAGGEMRWVNVRGVATRETDAPVFRGTVQDITERKARSGELERYERIVETTADPIYTLDDNLRFVLANSATADLLGRDPDDLVGEHVSTVFGEHHSQALLESIASLLAGDSDKETMETVVVDRDGAERQFQTTIAAKSSEDEFEGIVCVGRDVTELQERERRLSVLDRVIRHNLRNKMNIAQAHAAMLLEHTDDDVLESAAAIERATSELLSLAETARKFSSALDPNVAERVQPQNVADCVRNVVEGAQLSYPDATITVDAPDVANARAHTTFELAVNELIDNAVVYGGDEVEIHLSVTDDDGPEQVVIRVADNGPGIPPLERESLNSGRESPLQHTNGLGLWFVRWAVTNSNGSMEITDNQPNGTVIELRLPRA